MTEKSHPSFSHHSAQSSTSSPSTTLPSTSSLLASSWWKARTVADLKLETPLTVTPAVTCQQCVDILNKQGYDQLPCVSNDNQILGSAADTTDTPHLYARLAAHCTVAPFNCVVLTSGRMVTLGNLTSLLLSSRVQPDDSVSTDTHHTRFTSLLPRTVHSLSARCRALLYCVVRSPVVCTLSSGRSVCRLPCPS